MEKFSDWVNRGGEPVRAESITIAVAAGMQLMSRIAQRNLALEQGEYETAVSIDNEVGHALDVIGAGDVQLSQLARDNGETEAVVTDRENRKIGIMEFDQAGRVIQDTGEFLSHIAQHIAKAKLALMEQDMAEFGKHVDDARLELQAILQAEAGEIEEAQKSAGPPEFMVDLAKFLQSMGAEVSVQEVRTIDDSEDNGGDKKQ